MQISKQRIDSLDLRLLENNAQSGNDNTTLIESDSNKQFVIDFPRCILAITGKLSSASSRLKVNGLHVKENGSSEFNMSSLTGFDELKVNYQGLVKKGKLWVHYI